VDLLAARIADRLHAQHARADGLRARLPACARLLRARGATRVVLFGSLATGATPHEATDVDLAVWGLSEEVARDVILDLEELVGAAVDLVPMESAPASLVARVARDGVEIRDVAG
jgi:predicted nucleotidyltransferase